MKQPEAQQQKAEPTGIQELVILAGNLASFVSAEGSDDWCHYRGHILSFLRGVPAMVEAHNKYSALQEQNAQLKRERDELVGELEAITSRLEGLSRYVSDDGENASLIQTARALLNKLTT